MKSWMFFAVLAIGAAVSVRAQTLTILGSLDNNTTNSGYRMYVILNGSYLYDDVAPFPRGSKTLPFTFQRFNLPFPLGLIREGNNQIIVGLYGAAPGYDWLCWDSMYVQIGDTVLALESDADVMGYSPTGVDRVYSFTQDTVSFFYVRGRMTIVGSLNDSNGVYIPNPTNYRLTVLLNGDTLHSGITPFKHAIRENYLHIKNFQRWTIPFATTLLRPGTNRLTMALTGVDSWRWICWDSLYVDTRDTVLALESPADYMIYSPTGVTVIFGGSQREYQFQYGEEPVRVLRDERPRIQRVVSTKKYRLNGRRTDDRR